MSNPTTPFGWQMPEATDLVTDLPADFEVFGQAVATDLQYLLGGTTGQVLAKASGTDLDFDWVTDATGMTNPMTTTADVIYSSSGSTPARLGIGTANQVLAVNSGATAPEWQTISSGGMTLISTTTLSGTSVTLSSIPATYKHLLVTFSNITANSNYYFHLKPNNASNCDYQSYDMGSSAGSVSSYSGAGFSFNTNTGVNSSNAENAGSLWIYNYESATLRKNVSSSFGYRSASAARAAVNVGLINTTSAISSLVFDAGGNTFTAGTLLLYGVL
jgi:hypothetical protein